MDRGWLSKMATYYKEKLLAPGEYEAVISQAHLSYSAIGHNEMVVVYLHVKTDESRWSTVRDYLVFSEKSRWKFDLFLEAIGIELEDGKEIDDQVVEQFVGRTARVLVSTRDFGNREQNWVERWFPNAETR